MRRFLLTAVLLPILLISACAAPTGPGSAETVDQAAPAAGPDLSLPSGWRWESFGGVQVGVPGDWGWGSSSQRLGQWCIATDDELAEPIVGRSGYQTLAGCPDTTQPKPATLIENTGSVVGFDRTTQPAGVQQEGDQTAVSLNGVLVTVNAPRELRRRIVETIRQVNVDSYGCPTTHPISVGPWRPRRHPVAVTALRDVSTVSVCKFRLGEVANGAEPRLVSAMSLHGPAAEQAIREIAAAPLGGGPNHPEHCLPRVSYGDEGVVLLVHSASGQTEIVLRYSGCDHKGIDDGVAVRRVTDQVMAAFLTGPNWPPSLYGPLTMPSARPSTLTFD